MHLSSENLSPPDPTRDYRDDLDDLLKAGRVAEAVDLARWGFGRWPDHPESARVLGVVLTLIGELQEAEPLLRRALEGLPEHSDYRFALGINLLGQGKFGEGWPLYRAREQATETGARLPTGMPFPRWQGESLGGKNVLLVPEQGLGDQIQFARFLPMLTAAGARVSLLAASALERLFRENYPEVAVIAAAGQVKLPPTDFWSTLIDLPGVLGITAGFPQPPYLAPHQTWTRAPAGFKVGLATFGATTHSNDYWRSLPADDAAALAAQLPGAVVPLDPSLSGARDLADTAAIIAQLDVVVTVDTAVGHLAGAMNKPCLLLLPDFGADWRWMRKRADSPWYPNHRLYRCGVDRDWRPVFDRVVDDVRAMASSAGA